VTSDGWLLMSIAVLIWPTRVAAKATVGTGRRRRAAQARERRDLAVALDLAAAALRCGQPVGTALAIAAPTVDGPVGARLGQVAVLLRLGADPADAWRVVAKDSTLGPVAHTAQRSANSGIRLANGLEAAADDLREQLRAAAQARAHRVGVLVAAPLGLCFLPAFVCLGVVPVIIGLAGAGFDAMP